MAGEAAAPAALAAVVVDHGHAEMQLDVRNVEIGPALQKAAAFGKIRCHRPAPLAPVLSDRAQLMRNAGKGETGEIGRIGEIREDEIRMVLQILPDTGQMMQRCYAVACER